MCLSPTKTTTYSVDNFLRNIHGCAYDVSICLDEYYTTGATGATGIIVAKDPNELTGPKGYGAANYLPADSLLPYRVDFENDATATAPAQRVDIDNQLPDSLDWNSFQFTEIGFGDELIAVPKDSRQAFETTVPMAYQDVEFEVKVQAGIDTDTGMVSIRFYSLQPDSELPPPVDIGFLPPENGTGRGMGYFAYTVDAKPDLAENTEIRNIAKIVFDLGEVIYTNQVDPHNPSQGTDPAKEALVTIDALLPSSTVAALPETSPPTFTVTWSGSDSASGIAAYDVYVREGETGGWQLWQEQTTEISTEFAGEVGVSYAFYSVATDNVGYTEEKTAQAEAVTTAIDAEPDPNERYSAAGTIYNGETLSHTVDLSGFIAPLTVTLESADGELALMLTAPDGTLFDAASTEVEVNGNTYTVHSDREGAWQIDVVAVNVDPAGEAYSLNVSVTGAAEPQPTTQTAPLLVAQAGGHNEIVLYSADGEEQDRFDPGTGDTELNIRVLDSDGDGIRESVAIADGQGGSEIELFLLEGFTPISSIPVDAAGIAFDTGDLDGDGIADFVIAGHVSNRKTVDGYLSGHAWQTPATFELFAQNTRISVGAGDADGDGVTDIIGGDLLGKNGNDQDDRHDVVSLLLSGGGDPIVFPVFADSRQIHGVNVFAHDLNCDGRDEIIAAMADKGAQVEIYAIDNGMPVLLNQFEAFAGYQHGVKITAGDVNLDGVMKIVAGQAKGNRVAIFDADGGKLDEFTTVDISSLAVTGGDFCEMQAAPDNETQTGTDDGSGNPSEDSTNTNADTTPSTDNNTSPPVADGGGSSTTEGGANDAGTTPSTDNNTPPPVVGGGENSSTEGGSNDGGTTISSDNNTSSTVAGNSGNASTGESATDDATTSADENARLVNFSAHAKVNGGQNDIFAGLVISGNGMQRIMVRGIAAANGVDPLLTLLERKGTSWEYVAINDDWKTDINASSVSALPLHLQLPDTYGNDAGVLVHLQPGVYSAQLSSNASEGFGLVGLDAIDGNGSTLTNISARTYIDGDENNAFIGFIISGRGTLQVMLRGIAVTRGLDPVMNLLKLDGTVWDGVATNDEWESDHNAAAVSALPAHLQLPDTYDNDAGMLIDLEAGVYSIQMSSNNGPGLAVVGVDTVE